MKKLSLLMLSGLLLSSASAMAMRIDFNGGQYRLPECGGTIEAKGGILQAIETGAQDNQVNLIVRDSENCSRVVLQNTGREYKMEGRERDWGGSYTISTGALHYGWNLIEMDVTSRSGRHSDHITLYVNVVDSGYETPFACKADAKDAARDQYRIDLGRRSSSSSARLDRISERGNYVYIVTVDGRAGRVRYETVMRPDCSLAATPRAL